MRNLNVKLPDAVYQHIEQQAAREFKSKSEYLRQLAVEDMERASDGNGQLSGLGNA